MVRKTKKKVGSVHTAKNGARYKIMANGQARFIKSGARKRPKKGGSITVAGGLRRKRRGAGFWSDMGRDIVSTAKYYTS